LQQDSTNEQQQLLTLMQKAFDKAKHGNMDASKMVTWLQKELQSEYTFVKEKAL
jgi:SPX domain protein involved in polyphosphate accumulation